MKLNRFDFLVAVYIACIAIAELLGSKTTPLFSIGGLNLSASVALLVIPLIFTINDIIYEVYGKARARSVMASGLFVIGLILVVTLIATALPPSTRFAPDEAAYDSVFGKSARIAAASLTAFALAQLLDIWVFSKLREKLGKHSLWLRNNASNFAAQFIDTFVFITLAFYAFGKPITDNVDFLIGLIIPYWILKCAMSVLITPLVYLGVYWLKGDKQKSH